MSRRAGSTSRRAAPVSRRAAPRRLLVAAAVGLAVLAAAAPPAAAASSPPPSATAMATATATATAPASGAPTPTATPAGGLDVGGVMFVSGVRTEYHPSWNPLAGRLHIEMTVRNATTQVLDASASYGARTLVGFDLGAGDTLSVRGLAPGEIRTVEADVEGIGQWALVRAHMTIAPPTSVGGVALAPLGRYAWVVAPPWYLAGLVVVVVGLVVLLRRHPLPRPAFRRRPARRAALVRAR